MRENRQSGSEGGGTETNRFSLPLSRHAGKWMGFSTGSGPQRLAGETPTSRARAVPGLRFNSEPLKVTL